ncbi:hypothetical protein [Nocardia wallacei]|uniref:hypothetical protein n=1 Tax=Nocardia wallacei TaxID=480035 RepID=UPI002455B1B9|nr:hypothetical protein [Nocardia wallacei]
MTKVYLACERGRKLLSLVIIAGQRADCPQFQAVLKATSVPRRGDQLRRAPTSAASTCAGPETSRRSRSKSTSMIWFRSTIKTDPPGGSRRPPGW